MGTESYEILSIIMFHEIGICLLNNEPNRIFD